jgi:hypothetical protein
MQSPSQPTGRNIQKRNRTLKSTAAYQNVFRLRRPQLISPAQSKFQLPGKQTDEPVYHTRRSHRKSRSGCGNCKQRRVKVRSYLVGEHSLVVYMARGNEKLSRKECDERKPECERCQKYGIACDYTDARSPSTLAVFEPDTAMSTMSLASIERTIGQLLGMDERYCDILFRLGPDTSRLTNLAILHHFITHSTENVPNSSFRMILRTDLIRTAFTVLSPRIPQVHLLAFANHLFAECLSDACNPRSSMSPSEPSSAGKSTAETA